MRSCHRELTVKPRTLSPQIILAPQKEGEGTHALSSCVTRIQQSTNQQACVCPLCSMVYDISGPGPREREIWLNDLSEEGIEVICSEDFGIEYLSVSAGCQEKVSGREGKVWGANNYLVVPMACRDYISNSPKSYNVLFVVATVTSETYLSAKNMGVLRQDADHSIVPDGVRGTPSMYVDIEGVAVHCYQSHGHFADANVLGMGALRDLGWSPMINWADNTFMLTSLTDLPQLCAHGTMLKPRSRHGG
ncbi:unnamed protein product [Vitrella brassicaformis CCMP3155]|uniref:Uncharacterized protein n=1 Tax=Vitrella brassicaformis (strain CCMP3155) TaxID=1169540 RepID=A0A0G4GS80_VITBC|nr:unnamed protein product [Vitrella brassicaformis CCMP3155]|eukprot:CEM33481.1 unnamed protein product [Vitrella brassicaformis CCMP3155]